MDTQYYKVPRIVFQQILKYLRKQPFEEVNDYLVTMQSEVIGPLEFNEIEIKSIQNKQTIPIESKEEE